ncbi:fumarylacetoacetate hydrolase family protein [Brooklawnia cerclae]|uniref:Acylpyruvate hydrolase n=1 Tax=Brooklawnia cerclae TaxID=349934 RepID=A0ABX0SPD7_9ACTN|nr:fumarylacetoacetate hydrolase family protein [Brooklawnia cerclae]NIH58626.1 acylpyruvate hydrolase [Brooklawnia cerclae]
MHLVRFDDGAGPRLGCLLDGPGGARVLDVSRVLPERPADVGELFALGDSALASVRAAVAEADPGLVVPRDTARLLAPVARPGKILCVGYNYRGHTSADDRGSEDGRAPEFPDIFAKTPNVLIGPGEPILIPPTTTQVDYEAELTVVIGRRGRQLTPEQARDHIGGYTIFNDVSARDWQGRGSQWLLGKSFDTFGPLGPSVITSDELDGTGPLEVSASCNGEVTLRSDTSRMFRDPAWLVSHISQAMTLEPGDLIATGTPQKFAGALAHQSWLRPGDSVSITISGLGALTNPVAAMPPESLGHPVVDRGTPR